MVGWVNCCIYMYKLYRTYPLRAGLVHVNSGVVGAELSAELLQIKADMVLVELTDDDVDVHGLVTMNLHKAHVFWKFFFKVRRDRAWDYFFLPKNMGLVWFVLLRDLHRWCRWWRRI